MFEIDFLPVGGGSPSGDAIAMRFTRPDTGALAHVILHSGEYCTKGLQGFYHRHGYTCKRAGDGQLRLFER